MMVYPAPNSAQIWRKATSVTPAMGARAREELMVSVPMFKAGRPFQ